jgi:hypothetical protein
MPAHAQKDKEWGFRKVLRNIPETTRGRKAEVVELGGPSLDNLALQIHSRRERLVRVQAEQQAAINEANDKADKLIKEAEADYVAAKQQFLDVLMKQDLDLEDVLDRAAGKQG